MAQRPQEPKSSEVTPPELYARRREFLKQGALYVATSTAVGVGLSQLSSLGSADPPKKPEPGAKKKKPAATQPAPAKPAKQKGYRAFATATGLYVPESDPLKTGRKTPASSLSQSAAGAAVGTSGLKTTDLFGENACKGLGERG